MSKKQKDLETQLAIQKFLDRIPTDSTMFGQRFAIIGFTGSGKTTYAKRLSKITTSPHIELDRLYWKDKWQRPSNEEFLQQVSASLQGMNGEGWIVDGNHAECRSYVWAKCDTIIWLDYRKPVIFKRFMKRFASNYIMRKKLWGTNNRESIWRGIFGKKGIIRRLSQNYESNREEIFFHIKKYTFRNSTKTHSAVRVIRFTGPERADEWLNYLELIHALDRNRKS